ncbi:DUF3592 domain-containing protein [Nocardioides zeae]|uniref:DUF3592 domain-containing protein n=1 Tax=Nocardioides imazamoxiresistens TaxID=3231893 RepID=A0ABU3PQH3_9ACTN|nr:DUF3592 domain-containing protein [Nocardioides zeae]MDT9591473.1 DUF3592 domain-containing protein [Nocardioides zeae]
MDHSGEDAWGALVLGGAALLPALVVLGLRVRWLRLRRSWVRVEATVVGHRKRKTVTHDNTRTYRRVSRYRFHDASGVEHRGDGSPRLRKGAVIGVLHDPADPQRNEPARPSTPVVLGWAVAVLMVPLALYGIQWGLAGLLGHEPLLEVGPGR